MTSVAVHRCRFISYNPSTITALAITPSSFDASALHLSDSSTDRGILAVGRANGNVQLMHWHERMGWVEYQTLPSPFAPSASGSQKKQQPALLSHLVFTHQTQLSPSDEDLYSNDEAGGEKEIIRLKREGVRLFGVGGLGSELVEWEWSGLSPTARAVGSIKATLPSLPPIFSVAASPSSSTLALGCSDGTIRLVSIFDDELEQASKIDVGGIGRVRAISLAWGPPGRLPDEGGKKKQKAKALSEEDEDDGASRRTTESTYLLAGLSNSSIQMFRPALATSLSVLRPSHRLAVARTKADHTVVWCLSALSGSTGVSADSRGCISWWDLSAGVLISEQRAGKADILAMTVGSEGRTIYTSGVDQKTSEFARIQEGGKEKWVKSSSRRMHAHDVRAMIVSPPFEATASTAKARESPILPILTSGGLDLSLVLVTVAAGSNPSWANPVSESKAVSFEGSKHRKCSYVSQRTRSFQSWQQGSGSQDRQQFLLERNDRTVSIWRFGGDGVPVADEEDEEEEQEVDIEQIRGDREKAWEAHCATLGTGENSASRREAEDLEDGGWERVLDMELQLQTNLIASASSKDGRWLAVSDLYETKLFRLTSKSGQLFPRRHKPFTSVLASAATNNTLGTGSSSIVFTPDGKRIIVSSASGSGTVTILALPNEAMPEEEPEVKVLAVIQPGGHSGNRKIKGALNGNGAVNGVARNGATNGHAHESEDEDEMDVDEPAAAKNQATVVLMTVSMDNKFLAVADGKRNVWVYDLVGLKHHASLPTATDIPTALSFLPASSSSHEISLVYSVPSNALYLFGLTSQRFHNVTSALADPRSNALMGFREPALGIEVDTWKTKATVVVWGANWVGKIPIATFTSVEAPAAPAVLKRKRSRKSLTAGAEVDSKAEPPAAMPFAITTRFHPLLHFGFLGKKQIVAVERPWFDLVRELPDAWITSGLYGT